MNLMEKYRARLGDTGGGTPNSGPPVEELLDTPLPALREPLLIESERLGDERIFLCADEAQAKEIEKAGSVYTPAEVRSLLSLQAGMDLGKWKIHLANIHEVKKAFRGARLQ